MGLDALDWIGGGSARPPPKSADEGHVRTIDDMEM